MKKIYLVGIGTGNPDHITLQAANTIKKSNVFFILEKESEKNRDLIKLREEILQKCLPDGNYKKIMLKIPERKKAGQNLSIYKERVEEWRKQKAEIIAMSIDKDMTDNEKGAILIWGDPSFYDGHIEIMDFILKNGMAKFEYEVIPGITSMQVLAAQHKIPLNSIGESIHITTGRRLKEINGEEIKNTVTLLDNYLTYKKFKDTDLYIYWGAYLGTDMEILISGKLKDVVDKIIRTRNEARKKNGWIMETYILRDTNKV